MGFGLGQGAKPTLQACEGFALVVFDLEQAAPAVGGEGLGQVALGEEGVKGQQ